MHLVTCSECGKRYNYDKDDFCPKCGVYNPPGRQQPRQAAPARTSARPARSYAAQAKREAVRSQAGGAHQEKKSLSFSQIIIVLVVLYFVASIFLPLLAFLF